MAIQLQFLSLIIPKEKVEQYYPGGLAQYKTDKNKSFLEDDFLIREGAMGPYDIEAMVKKWETLGLVSFSYGHEVRKWKDMCVVDYFGGPTLKCDWLICRGEFAYHKDDKTVSLMIN